MHGRESVSIGYKGRDVNLCVIVKELLVAITIWSKGDFSLYSFDSCKEFFMWLRIGLKFGGRSFNIKIWYEKGIFDGFFIGFFDISLTGKLCLIGFYEV